MMILVAAAATERVIGELDVIGEPEIPAVARVAGDRRTSSLDLERERRSRASGRASCIGAQCNQESGGGPRRCEFVRLPIRENPGSDPGGRRPRHRPLSR